MTEKLGWQRYSNRNKILYFKGYFNKNNIENIFEKLDKITIGKNISIIDFDKVLRQISGNFSFVFSWGCNVFAAVDKICSIPIFYVDSNEKIFFHDPELLNKYVKSSCNYLNKSSVLEIAMSGYTIGRKTLYKNVYQLTAGECALFNENKLHRRYYYTYTPWMVDYRDKKILKTHLTESILHSFKDLINGVSNRQIVVPLSAGLDSRIIASTLRYLGFKDVFCFSYGSSDSFELKASKAISEKLGYPWRHIPLTRKSQREFFGSDTFKDFCSKSDNFSSTTFTQDVSAVMQLKESGLISKDAVFVNGNTGDYISGGHIPASLKEESFDNFNYKDVYKKSFTDFLDKHFSLWGVLRSDFNDNYIIQSLENLIADRGIKSYKNIDLSNMHGLFECLEYLGRQSKYIVNMQRSYEFFDYDWRMPLWSDHMLDFWESVPRVYKLNQNLYKDVVYGNNWGGVWRDIPVNNYKINSSILRFSRFVSKVAISPFGKNTWHEFDRKVFQYFLDDVSNSSIKPYYKVLLDNKRHRNSISWLTEKYLHDKGLKDIFNDFIIGANENNKR